MGTCRPNVSSQGQKPACSLLLGSQSDPVHDRIVAASASSVRGGTTGLFIFGRTDNGDVPPHAVIAGPHTGIVRPWQLSDRAISRKSLRRGNQ